MYRRHQQFIDPARKIRLAIIKPFHLKVGRFRQQFSLKDPRLSVFLYGADRIAYRRLQGIYPGLLESDRQSWL
ncbi:hypothetical protein NIES593_21220 [Hydrococcus rivularis NIES-593]|uniref:Uncharacterized protein n=1 Tax=Hydrococcus rivularis NIES-593 TaxID=1921803 RepID=A0A1U7H8E7_9CYAN|nr:hypothetical protein [Hydrococcus rivularis]OKH19163.1 hypothetical protein NIES593_21220 [Hydrococcus rivularis NIES-593]